MPEQKDFLQRVYKVTSRAGAHALYQDWAADYETVVAENGYITPTRCAEALAAHVDDLTVPLLDLGCGTGLSGMAFREVGFTTIDGADFSTEMLRQAAAKKGLYRCLIAANLDAGLPGKPGAYEHLAAVGIFSPNHAPASLLGAAIGGLPAGGCFVFSLNDHCLAVSSYTAGSIRSQLPVRQRSFSTNTVRICRNKILVQRSMFCAAAKLSGF